MFKKKFHFELFLQLCRLYLNIHESLEKGYLAGEGWFVYLMVLRWLMIHMLQQGLGDFRENSNHHDSILLPNVSLLSDYEKHSLYLGSIPSEC